MHDEPYTPKLCECGCGTELPVPKWPSWQRRFIDRHAQVQRTRPLADRFWPKTQPATDLSPNGMSGCLLWTGNAVPSGYGKIQYGPVKIPATHGAWILAGRERPLPGHDLDHLCRRHSCVNIEHLELVTHAENVRRGAQTRLTAEQVADIRYLRSAGWNTQGIAEAYGVSRSHVNKICHGDKWVN